MPKTFVSEAVPFLETWLTHLFPTLQQPSISVAIVHDGKVAYKNAWGYANVEKKEKATPEHIYRIASHSKSITSFLVGMLVDEGTLKLDEPLLTYLPWLKANPAYAQLTLRHVMSHSTGNQRDGDRAGCWYYQGSFPTRQELKTYFTTTRPVIEPNTRFKYSNHGFGLVALVIEAATGKKYEDLITARILKPLKLTRTGPDNPPASQKAAIGYSLPLPDGTWHPFRQQLAANGLNCATGFHSTAAENALLFHSFLMPGKYLSPQVRHEILHPVWPTTPDKTDQPWYALGLRKTLRKGHTYYGHSGGYPGFRSVTYTCPELDITVSAQSNCLTEDVPTLVFAILDILWHMRDQRGLKNPLSRYEGPFFNLWGSYYLLAGAGKMVFTSLLSKSPVGENSTLIPQKTKSRNPHQAHFTIKGVDGFGSGGEPAIITLEKGKPVHLLSGAHESTSDYQKYLKSLKSI